MYNPPKNNTPDKALVEATEQEVVKLDKARNYWMGRALKAEAALSQPQHGGLVEAIMREVRILASVARASPYWDNATADQLDALYSRICALAPTPTEVSGGAETSNGDGFEFGQCKDCPGKHSRLCCANGSSPTPTDTAAHISDAPKKGVVDWEAVADIIAAKVSGPRLKDDAFKKAHRLDQLAAADAILSLIAVPDGMVQNAIDKLSGIASPSAGVLSVEQAEALTVLIAAATGEA